ncbi:MAG TPA: PIG-L deacetylase family protein [Candidatus Acidoferrum sp.]|nr:PIG-L deacetylase family protein [Candidatus Acidoferrum sp.]
MILWVVVFVFALWLVGFCLANNFWLSTKSLRTYKHVLVVFPHADDEVWHGAGLLSLAARYGHRATWIVMTKGERGTPDAHLDEQLKKIRTEEAEAVAKLYNADLIQADFGDGQLDKKRSEFGAWLETQLHTLQPDLIVTYDLAGEYGHPDHMALSEIITSLVKQKYPSTALWYATFPKLVLSLGKFPTHMAEDPAFMHKRAVARFRVFTGSSILRKLQAFYTYKSQNKSGIAVIPYHIPAWFVYSLFWFEYFDIGN